MIDKSREIALKTLIEIEENKAYSNITLNKNIKENKNKLNEKDIAFISELVYGTTSFKLTLDEVIKKYSKIKINKISKWILNILRLGIYQIIFLDKVPKSAAVNESVNLAKRYGHTASSNFVNAKLRKKMIIMTGILCVAIFFIMTAIANVRVNKEVTFNSFIRSIFVHSTVSDIAYTYNAAIQYNIEHENLYGKTYKSYLIEAIPLLKSDTDVEKILLDEYATVGGNYLLGEPVINFGIIGVVIFKIVELYIIYNLAKHKYKINYFWYLFLIATIFRSIWYGLSYIELGMLYMVPIFYIIAFKRRAITKYIYQAKAMFQRKE